MLLYLCIILSIGALERYLAVLPLYICMPAYRILLGEHKQPFTYTSLAEKRRQHPVTFLQLVAEQLSSRA